MIFKFEKFLLCFCPFLIYCGMDNLDQEVTLLDHYGQVKTSDKILGATILLAFTPALRANINSKEL